jgi:hypothetical protein
VTELVDQVLHGQIQAEQGVEAEAGQVVPELLAAVPQPVLEQAELPGELLGCVVLQRDLDRPAASGSSALGSRSVRRP